MAKKFTMADAYKQVEASEKKPDNEKTESKSEKKAEKAAAGKKCPTCGQSMGG